MLPYAVGYSDEWIFNQDREMDYSNRDDFPSNYRQYSDAVVQCH